MGLKDSIARGLDRAKQVTESAIDEGKLRVQAYQARQRADKKAETLGYAVGRAKAEGREPDPAAMAMLVDEFITADRDATALETQSRSGNA